MNICNITIGSLSICKILGWGFLIYFIGPPVAVLLLVLIAVLWIKYKK